MEWAAGVSQRFHLTPRIPSLDREHRTDELISWGWIHGVHSVPSLKLLHVHVMTLDLNSPCMKMLGLQNTSQWPHVFCSALYVQRCARVQIWMRGMRSTSAAQLNSWWFCTGGLCFLFYSLALWLLRLLWRLWVCGFCGFTMLYPSIYISNLI